MTGQGDKNFERIKRGKFNRSAIDVSGSFRTANNLPVRNLRVGLTNKTVINGKVITTAHYHEIITGQVHTKNKWLPAEWDAQGRHPQEQFNLVEQKETHSQGSLF